MTTTIQIFCWPLAASGGRPSRTNSRRPIAGRPVEASFVIVSRAPDAAEPALRVTCQADKSIDQSISPPRRCRPSVYLQEVACVSSASLWLLPRLPRLVGFLGLCLETSDDDHHHHHRRRPGHKQSPPTAINKKPQKWPPRRPGETFRKARCQPITGLLLSPLVVRLAPPDCSGHSHSYLWRSNEPLDTQDEG